MLELNNCVINTWYKIEQIYETPQFAYMLIAITFFKDYKENRIDYM